MNRLGEEWKKRDYQRQRLLEQKLQNYCRMEGELQVGLEKLQHQQKTLINREIKVELLKTYT